MIVTAKKAGGPPVTPCVRFSVKLGKSLTAFASYLAFFIGSPTKRVSGWISGQFWS